MISRVAVLALLFVAATAVAQEFGRAGGDEIPMLVKQPGGFSGSLGFSMSKGAFASKQLTGALGGTLVADRLWFFATAQHDNGQKFVSVTPQLNDRQVLAAAAGTGRESTGTTPALTLPSSFLSMRYTGMLSSSSYFTANVTTRRTSAEPAFTVFH
jgi:hypothetical protein